MRASLNDVTPIGPVLLVSPWYRPTIGGVVAVTERLRELLRDNAVETFLWVCDDDNPAPPGGPELGSPQYVRIPSYLFYAFSLRNVLATLLVAPLALFRTWRFVRKHRIKTVILVYPIGYAWPFVL